VGGSHPATRAPKLKKKFLKRLLHSEPITPKHQPAKTIGGQFGSHVSEEVRAFFADFADFANVVNWWLADEHVDSRWRLQELPETELSLHGVFDCGPIFGRSYAVFYNQVRVGELEVTPLFKYNPDRPELITRIHLEYVRLLSLETIRDFFHAIGMHACCYKNSKEYFEAQQAIDRALTKALWRSNRVDVYNINAPDYGEIDLQLDGVASWYLERREALRKQEAARALFRPRP
jgi:hypothetical protein